MKRIYYFLTLAVMVLAPLAMTSCDDPYYDDWWYDDPDEWYDRPYDNGSDDLVAMAQMLNGSWTGELTNEYTGEDGNRYQANMYVDFRFIQPTLTTATDSRRTMFQRLTSTASRCATMTATYSTTRRLCSLSGISTQGRTTSTWNTPAACAMCSTLAATARLQASHLATMTSAA